MYGKSNMETYITICKIHSQQGICCEAQETQTGPLINLERWDGKGDGRGKEMGWKFKREGMCIPMADSC